jgi:hypothetical protein
MIQAGDEFGAHVVGRPSVRLAGGNQPLALPWSRLIDLTGHQRSVSVVGDAPFQSTLGAAAGAARLDWGDRVMIQAVLVPEPANPYDPNGVRIVVPSPTGSDGWGMAGYLSRNDAAAFGKARALLVEKGWAASCEACLIGGLSIGVVLYLDDWNKCLATLQREASRPSVVVTGDGWVDLSDDSWRVKLVGEVALRPALSALVARGDTRFRVAFGIDPDTETVAITADVGRVGRLSKSKYNSDLRDLIRLGVRCCCTATLAKDGAIVELHLVPPEALEPILEWAKEQRRLGGPPSGDVAAGALPAVVASRPAIVAPWPAVAASRLESVARPPDLVGARPNGLAAAPKVHPLATQVGVSPRLIAAAPVVDTTPDFDEEFEDPSGPREGRPSGRRRLELWKHVLRILLGRLFLGSSRTR